jgi:hypothetical protein
VQSVSDLPLRCAPTLPVRGLRFRSNGMRGGFDGCWIDFGIAVRYEWCSGGRFGVVESGCEIVVAVGIGGEVEADGCAFDGAENGIEVEIVDCIDIDGMVGKVCWWWAGWRVGQG